MSTYLIEQRVERRRQDRMLRRLTLPGDSSHRALVIVLLGCAAIVALARLFS